MLSELRYRQCYGSSDVVEAFARQPQFWNQALATRTSKKRGKSGVIDTTEVVAIMRQL
jgi:hypothetical protein